MLKNIEEKLDKIESQINTVQDQHYQKNGQKNGQKIGILYGMVIGLIILLLIKTLTLGG